MNQTNRQHVARKYCQWIIIIVIYFNDVGKKIWK